MSPRSPITSLAPTGTNSVTTLPELLCQVSSRASSAWTTLRVSPELSDLGPGIAVPGGRDPPRRYTDPPVPPHRCCAAEGWGERSSSVLPARADRSLSSPQLTLECRATVCEWRPPTTTSLPWCSSRKFSKTRSSSRSPSTVGPHPPHGGPQLLVTLEGCVTPDPAPEVPSSASSAPSPRDGGGLSTDSP